MNSETTPIKFTSGYRRFNFPAFLIAFSSTFFIFATVCLPTVLVLLVQAVIFFLVYGFLCRNGVFPKKKASVFELFYFFSLIILINGNWLIVSLKEFYPSIVQWEAEMFPSLPFSVLGVILWLGSMPFLFWVTRWIFFWILPDIKRFFTSFTRAETIFAAVLFLLMFGVVFWTSTQTSFFIAPKAVDSFLPKPEPSKVHIILAPWNSEKIFCNNFMKSDPRTFTSLWNFSSLNEFRHPFYGFAWMPFIPLFLLLTLIFYWCGFGVWFYSAGLAAVFLQIVWWTITAVMLRRLVKEITDRSFSFALMVLYALSFPALFVFIPERLILTTATLVAFVYFWYTRKPAQDHAEASRLTPADSVWAFAAIGTTLTSVLIPVWVLWQYRTSFRGFFKEIFRFAVLSSVVFVLLGACLLDLHDGICQCFRWTPHTSEVEVADSAQKCQYLHFLEANIFTPDAAVTSVGCNSVSFNEISSGCLYIGAAIGLLGLLAGMMYRRSFFVQTALLWSLTAFLLLCVLGFGARFNEMTLYVSYFSWAILPLAALPFYRLLGNRRHQAALFLFAAAAVTFGMNAGLFCEIVQKVSETYLIP